MFVIGKLFRSSLIKHSSLVQKSVNKGQKKFCKIGPGGFKALPQILDLAGAECQ